MERVKYPFVLKLLGDKLRQEEAAVIYWKEVLASDRSDDLAKRQANGNLSPTEGRITELKTVIELLNPNEKEKSPAKS